MLCFTQTLQTDIPTKSYYSIIKNTPNLKDDNLCLNSISEFLFLETHFHKQFSNFL